MSKFILEISRDVTLRRPPKGVLSETRPGLLFHIVWYSLNLDPFGLIIVRFFGLFEANIMARPGQDKFRQVLSNDITLVSLWYQDFF